MQVPLPSLCFLFPFSFLVLEGALEESGRRGLGGLIKPCPFQCLSRAGSEGRDALLMAFEAAKVIPKV